MLRAGFSRLRLVASALRDLLDLLLRQGLQAGEDFTRRSLVWSARMSFFERVPLTM